MNSEAFHEAIESAVKAALQNWSPEWESYPLSIYKIVKQTLQETLSSGNRDGYYFSIKEGGLIRFAIAPLSDSYVFDDDWIVHHFDIVKEVIDDAEDGGGEGDGVASAITALEGVIARLKEEAANRNWPLE